MVPILIYCCIALQQASPAMGLANCSTQFIVILLCNKPCLQQALSATGLICNRPHQVWYTVYCHTALQQASSATGLTCNRPHLQQASPATGHTRCGTRFDLLSYCFATGLACSWVRWECSAHAWGCCRPCWLTTLRSAESCTSSASTSSASSGPLVDCWTLLTARDCLTCSRLCPLRRFLFVFVFTLTNLFNVYCPDITILVDWA